MDLDRRENACIIYWAKTRLSPTAQLTMIDCLAGAAIAKARANIARLSEYPPWPAIPHSKSRQGGVADVRELSRMRSDVTQNCAGALRTGYPRLAETLRGL